MNYAHNKAKLEIINLLSKYLGKKDIEIESPPENIKADFSVPLFKFAKSMKKNPEIISLELEQKLDLKKTIFARVERKGAYLNFILNEKKYIKLVISEYQALKEKYGYSKGCKDKIIIDYSSPNIAKPFSIGHLRATIIGQNIYNIYKFLGYNITSDNHIGDWGTQFGKLIAAYKKWGSKEKLLASPMKESLNLYVKFHSEAKKEKTLEIVAREWFKKLEDGDKEALEIWKLFRNLSLNEFEHIYKTIDVKFDEMLGESFYKDKTEDVIKDSEKKGLAKWEYALDENGKASKTEKVLLVDLKKYGIETPLLLKKSDGTTLYATRDLAAIKYRLKKYGPHKIIYVVGSEQKLYFEQLFKVAKLLGYKTKLVHIDFGLISLPEGKLSTRAGRVIFLRDVIDESILKVRDLINNQEVAKKEKDEIAKTVGIGAIKYADLSQSRIKNIVFDFKKAINLKGNSGPYLQYQYVRIQSILRKAKVAKITSINPDLLIHEEEIILLKTVSKYNEVLNKVLINYEPHILTEYLFSLSELFSVFYEKRQILNANNMELRKARLYLSEIVAEVLKSGLNLLGINVPNKM